MEFFAYLDPVCSHAVQLDELQRALARGDDVYVRHMIMFMIEHHCAMLSVLAKTPYLDWAIEQGADVNAQHPFDGTTLAHHLLRADMNELDLQKLVTLLPRLRWDVEDSLGHVPIRRALRSGAQRALHNPVLVDALHNLVKHDVSMMRFFEFELAYPELHSLMRIAAQIGWRAANHCVPLMFGPVVLTAFNVTNTLMTYATLLELGCPVDQVGYTDRTVLFSARDVRVTTFLLSRGADPNWIDEFGNTPLLYMAQQEQSNWRVMQLLMGVTDVRITNEFGLSVLSLMPDTQPKPASDYHRSNLECVLERI